MVISNRVREFLRMRENDRFPNRTVVPAYPLTRLANDRQMTPSQKTVGQRLSGHAVIPTNSELPASNSWGQTIEPTSQPLENSDFTLAHSMNLRRRPEASARIDAVAAARSTADEYEYVGGEKTLTQ